MLIAKSTQVYSLGPILCEQQEALSKDKVRDEFFLKCSEALSSSHQAAGLLLTIRTFLFPPAGTPTRGQGQE